MKTFNVRFLYVSKFISQCLPIYAFYTILFIDRGMSVPDIAFLMALWSIFTIIFEVPSDVLADRWNRRNMLAIAAVLQGLCFLIWFISHTFLMFALGFVFWAVAGAFTSGTEEGLIYDNLKCDGRENSFAEVYGKARFYADAGIAAGIVTAGVIVSFVSIEIIALISAAVCFVNVIFILQLREKNYYSERLKEESVGFFGTFKDAAVLIKGSGAALVSLLFLILFACLGDYLDEYDALIINDLQLSHIWVSVILTVRFIFVALGDVLASVIQKKFFSVRHISFLYGAACIFLLIFTVLWNKCGFIIFGLALTGMVMAEILSVNILQNIIKEEGRATVMSFYGVGQNVVMICFSLVYASLAGIFTLQQVYFIISVYGIAGSLVFYLISGIMKNKDEKYPR